MESYPLLTGIFCYLVGLIVGVYSTKGVVSRRVAAAHKDGLEQGRREAEAEKAETGKVLTEKLRKLQETLVDTLDAYEDTVKTVDEKLSTEAGSQLSLEYKPVTLPEPQMKTQTRPNDVVSEFVSEEPEVDSDQESQESRDTGVLTPRSTGSFSSTGSKLRKTIFSRQNTNDSESSDDDSSTLDEMDGSEMDGSEADESASAKSASPDAGVTNGLSTSQQVH